MAKKVKLPGRVESAEVGGIVAGAGEILDDEKGKVQSVINSEVDAELVRLENEKQDNITVDGVPTEGSGNPVSSGAVYTADKALSDAIEAILLLIPSAASSLNQLADKTFVRDSIDTSTATFRGTFNVVSDLHLSASATHAQIEAALNALSLGADTNDYCFVQVSDSESTENIKVTERYKFNGTGWAYEYDLNNSGFTSDQWAAINSNITALLVTKLSQLPTADALAALLAGKQDNLTFDNEPTAGSNNPVKSGGIYARNNEIVALINALDAAKQDKLTFDSTPINGSSNPVTSGGVYEAIYLVQVTLAGLDGRLVNAESAITVLTENVGILRTLYQALNQSDIIVGALPSTGVANTVYRVPGTSSYADWMYYDGSWVKLAEYTTLDGYLYKGIAVPTGSPAASADKMFYFAMTAGTYTNFGGLAVTEGITVLKYDGANWTKEQLSYSDGIFDVTAYSGRSFASLDALLSDADINNLIPAAVRKPGMSIKFEDSYDHKYVQYRLMADEFTTDTTEWAICDEGVYVENSDYIYVKTDSDGKILWAIKTDGTVFYGAGVPQQVKDYIQAKIEELNLDKVEDIVTFLGTLLEGDKTLQDLLDGKVDKEEGKSLIDEDIAENLGFIDAEYAEVEVDADGKILGGRKTDGTRFENCPIETPSATTESRYESEWIEVVLDKEGKVIRGTKPDGTTYISKLETGASRLVIKNNNKNEEILLPDNAEILNASGTSVPIEDNYGADGKVVKIPISTGSDTENVVVRFKVKFNSDLNKRSNSIDYAAENPLLLNFFSMVSGSNKLNVGVLPDYVKNPDILSGYEAYGQTIGMQGTTTIKAVNANNVALKPYADMEENFLVYDNLFNKLLVGDQMFSIRWVDNTEEYKDVCMSNNGTTLTFYHSTDDSVISSYTLASYSTLLDLYNALDEDSHLEVKFYNLINKPNGNPYTQTRTPSDLMEFSGIMLVSKRSVIDGDNYVVGDYPTKVVYDNPPVMMYDKVDSSWHIVEIAAQSDVYNGMFCVCVDGFYLYADESIGSLSNPVIYIGGDENGAAINCSIKDIEIKFNYPEDTEVLQKNQYGFPMLVSSWHPKVYVLEMHEIEDIDDAEDVSSLDSTIYPRMEAIFQTMKDKGYVPISLDEFSRYVKTGELAYKRAYITSYDDTRYSIYLNPRIQSLHKRFGVHGHCVEITNRPTYVYDGTTYNVVDINDEMLRDGWEPMSHGRHQVYGRIDYETLLGYMEDSTSDTRTLHIPRKGFAYAGGSTNIMVNTVLQEYGWEFALGIHIRVLFGFALDNVKRCNNNMCIPRHSMSQHNEDGRVFGSIL